MSWALTSSTLTRVGNRKESTHRSGNCLDLVFAYDSGINGCFFLNDIVNSSLIVFKIAITRCAYSKIYKIVRVRVKSSTKLKLRIKITNWCDYHARVSWPLMY